MKILKRNGKLGQGVGALKMGDQNTLTNYGLSHQDHHDVDAALKSPKVAVKAG